jgi:hypothetical protein
LRRRFEVSESKLRWHDIPNPAGHQPTLEAAGDPLTDAEVAELDSYGAVHGRMAIPTRAAELWEREILFGRATPPAGGYDGLLKNADIA